MPTKSTHLILCFSIDSPLSHLIDTDQALLIIAALPLTAQHSSHHNFLDLAGPGHFIGTNTTCCGFVLLVGFTWMSKCITRRKAIISAGCVCQECLCLREISLINSVSCKLMLLKSCQATLLRLNNFTLQVRTAPSGMRAKSGRCDTANTSRN